jgi:hypothetical protein
MEFLKYGLGEKKKARGREREGRREREKEKGKRTSKSIPEDYGMSQEVCAGYEWQGNGEGIDGVGEGGVRAGRENRKRNERSKQKRVLRS